jgi:hypothetical protein
MKKFLLLTFLAASLALGAVSSENSSVQSGDGDLVENEAFPITVDFHCPRNFGFHIADEIPLKVTLETGEGPIVDLVNLPKKGEIHGSFEVRDVGVRKHRKSGGTVYTVFYRLQSFEPAIAFDIFVSRTATYFGPMKDIKGPIEDERTTIIWKVTIAVGGLMVLAALITWPWDFIRRRRRVAKESPNPTPRDRAVKALQEARERCFNYEDHRKHLFFEINTILRKFLKDVYGLNTANRPSMEILHHMKDHPLYEELKGLVGRINQVIYEGDAPVDLESVMRQFTGLMERIEEATHPGVKQA